MSQSQAWDILEGQGWKRTQQAPWPLSRTNLGILSELRGTEGEGEEGGEGAVEEAGGRDHTNTVGFLRRDSIVSVLFALRTLIPWAGSWVLMWLSSYSLHWAVASCWISSAC